MSTPEYSIKQLSDLSGASERTLRYYEERGLLSPTRKANGYRAYGQREVDALQSILLYRACGMSLDDIARITNDPAVNAHDALLHQLESLIAQKSQVEALIRTVEKTIASLEGKATMKNDERFASLKQTAIEENERIYGKEARQLYGDATVDASNAKLSEMTQEEWTDKEALEQAIIDQLKAAMASGSAEDAETLCRMHETWIRKHWPEGMYSRQAHAALAEGYVADERFTAYYDGQAGPGATQFLRDALAAYCA